MVWMKNADVLLNDWGNGLWLCWWWWARTWKEAKNAQLSFSIWSRKEIHCVEACWGGFGNFCINVLLRFLQKYGLQSHQVVQNFVAGKHVHFINDVDVNPIACAEQHVDPDPLKAQMPEELLKRARLILSTELGKDPILWGHICSIFRHEARITAEPTERGIQEIDQDHSIAQLFKSALFLHILEAEKEHLVTSCVRTARGESWWRRHDWPRDRPQQTDRCRAPDGRPKSGINSTMPARRGLGNAGSAR